MSTECVHHWIIENPNEAYERSRSSKFSRGICKYCKEFRDDFANFTSFDQYGWKSKRFGLSKKKS